MLNNRSMMKSTVIPELAYADPAKAAQWLEGAFGLSVRLRIANHRIQMNVGDGHVVLTDREARTPCSLMVRVDDVDAHHARAAAFGAQIVAPPETHPYGERQYAATDCGGHTWKFSQSVADVAPEDWGGTPEEL